MSLKDLNIKVKYNSDRDNLLEDFYIPALSESIEYDRSAGYFCSNSLAISAKGLSKFINNCGKIRLIANVVLNEEDKTEIKNAINLFQDTIIDEIENIEDELKISHIKMLGWLIKNKRLEIKIAVVPKGIEHIKNGIFKDKEGNIISFFGSDNETASGWLYNHEAFHAFCSWRDNSHLTHDLSDFEELWNNQARSVQVYPISEALEKKLIRISPSNDEEFQKLSKNITEELLEKNRLRYNSSNKESNLPKLVFREYQKNAINNWIKNDFKGIFEMATGTGKTISALGCLLEFYKKHDKSITIIVVPYNHLVLQWKKEVEKFNFNDKIIVAESSNSNWKNELVNYRNFINENYRKRIIILTTYNTFSNKTFIELINEFKDDALLIADEMHWSGADTFSKGLIDKYKFRLGLSATPNRYFDDEGTKNIISYFGGTIFEFDLEKAIHEINPDTGKTYLTPYDYFPIFVELEGQEFEDYLKLTKKLGRAMITLRDQSKKELIMQRLAEQRQKIIINANEKIEVFIDIIKKIKPVEDTLIYCSDKQINQVQHILNDDNIVNHRFTGEENTKPESKYGGLNQREFILKEFTNKQYKVLVAMKCLDEGVDIPQAKTAIILASSGNPKEYIQRRGRILRRSEGKEKAEIYDILVIPTISGDIPDELIEIERNIIRKELKRYEEFAKISDNYLDALNKIFIIKRKYNLI